MTYLSILTDEHLFSVLAWFSLLVGIPRLALADVSVSEIVSRWGQRQRAVKAVDIEWREHKWSLSARGERNAKSTRNTKAEDSEMKKRVWILDTMLRYRFLDVATQRSFDGAWNGTSTKTLHSAFGKRDYPAGFRSKKANSPDIYVMHTKPILLAFRPVETKMNGFNSDQLKVVDRHARVGGSDCVILSVQRPAASTTMMLWVAQSLGFCVVRCTYSVKGTLRRQIDISYSEQPVAQYVPTGWKISQYGGNGKTVLATRATVTKCEINPELTARDFDISFPVGTWVTDMCEKEVRDYIVQEDEDERRVTKSELVSGVSYDQLYRSKEGSTLPVARGNWKSIVFFSSIIAVIFVGAVVALRHRRRTRLFD